MGCSRQSLMKLAPVNGVNVCKLVFIFEMDIFSICCNFMTIYIRQVLVTNTTVTFWQRRSHLLHRLHKFVVKLSVKDQGVGDWGSCPGHQGGGGHQRGEGRAKIMQICITKNMWGAQSGNLAQGTRNHRSTSANNVQMFLHYLHSLLHTLRKR